jgi:hypothetical protein
MINESYMHQGKNVVVTALQKTDDPEGWDITIRIDGILRPLIALDCRRA